MDRSITRSRWTLVSEWWCYPADITADETVEMLKQLRDSLLTDFVACPLEYIEDRLFGGFACERDEKRLHACFRTGLYSYLAAERGEYWAATLADRQDTWTELIEANKGQNAGGPFTQDRPAA